jgi:hypothetical protein
VLALAVVRVSNSPISGESFDPKADPTMGLPWRSQMTAIAKLLSFTFPRDQVENDAFKTIIIFCGVGLVISLLLAINGLDMSAGFF